MKFGLAETLEPFQNIGVFSLRFSISLGLESQESSDGCRERRFRLLERRWWCPHFHRSNDFTRSIPVPDDYASIGVFQNMGRVVFSSAVDPFNVDPAGRLRRAKGFAVSPITPTLSL
jgi:hypothetical protein